MKLFLAAASTVCVFASTAHAYYDACVQTTTVTNRTTSEVIRRAQQTVQPPPCLEGRPPVVTDFDGTDGQGNNISLRTTISWGKNAGLQVTMCGAGPRVVTLTAGGYTVATTLEGVESTTRDSFAIGKPISIVDDNDYGPCPSGSLCGADRTCTSANGEPVTTSTAVSPPSPEPTASAPGTVVEQRYVYQPTVFE